ncbi:unnamed protein product [Heligmosomoides polygyrus]|uniref:Transmembrane protein 144 n=1 Tax=Heligmosomoides polygyrus TaxID=6339 RepID=A0A3P8C6Q7_HELPZ|nr:unnamed protein product [Heligmosomoides polygyrus]
MRIPGLYFQWMMCIGQTLFAAIVLCSTGWPPIFPLAMLSGAFFAVGNALTVYIMEGIGMAVGSLLWNTVTCVVGWAVTRFGLLGNPRQLPQDNVMNIIGVATDHEVSITSDGDGHFSAILLTLIVGFLYGNMLTPINNLVADSEETGNPSGVSAYYFSFAFGALLTSTLIFMVYSVIRRNQPFINAELTLPSLVSGIIYAIATFCFFLANQHLDQVSIYSGRRPVFGVIIN